MVCFATQPQPQYLKLLQCQLVAILSLEEKTRDEWSARIAFNARAQILQEILDSLSKRYRQQLRVSVKLVKGAAGKQKIEFEELVPVVVGLGERSLFGHNKLKSDAVATQKQILSDTVGVLKR